MINEYWWGVINNKDFDFVQQVFAMCQSSVHTLAQLMCKKNNKQKSRRQSSKTNVSGEFQREIKVVLVHSPKVHRNLFNVRKKNSLS